MTSTFALAEPTSLEEASALLSELADDARCYAGGVRLLLDIREGRDDPRVLVNLKRIPQLATAGAEGDGFRLGACLSHAAVAAACAEDPGLAVLPAMANAIGNVRVRNTATLGGNLAVADPHADPATALLLLDAEVEVFGPDGARRVPLAEFHTGPFLPALSTGEFIAGVHVRPLPPGTGWAYDRVQRLLPPTLTVAAAMRLRDGALAEVRLSVGSVGPVALRLGELEAALEGLDPQAGMALIDDRSAWLADAIAPVSDLWGSAEYKTYMSAVLLKRALAAAAARAQEASR
jgi:carbon-monoxide dehydrogenase medium subunit